MSDLKYVDYQFGNTPCPKCAEKDAEIADWKEASKVWSLVAKECDELRAKLDKAREALTEISVRDDWSKRDQEIAKEALEFLKPE